MDQDHTWKASNYKAQRVRCPTPLGDVDKQPARQQPYERQQPHQHNPPRLNRVQPSKNLRRRAILQHALSQMFNEQVQEQMATYTEAQHQQQQDKEEDSSCHHRHGAGHTQEAMSGFTTAHGISAPGRLAPAHLPEHCQLQAAGLLYGLHDQTLPAAAAQEPFPATERTRARAAGEEAAAVEPRGQLPEQHRHGPLAQSAQLGVSEAHSTPATHTATGNAGPACSAGTAWQVPGRSGHEAAAAAPAVPQQQAAAAAAAAACTPSVLSEAVLVSHLWPRLDDLSHATHWAARSAAITEAAMAGKATRIHRQPQAHGSSSSTDSSGCSVRSSSSSSSSSGKLVVLSQTFRHLVLASCPSIATVATLTPSTARPLHDIHVSAIPRAPWCYRSSTPLQEEQLLDSHGLQAAFASVVPTALRTRLHALAAAAAPSADGQPGTGLKAFLWSALPLLSEALQVDVVIQWEGGQLPASSTLRRALADHASSLVLVAQVLWKIYCLLLRGYVLQPAGDSTATDTPLQQGQARSAGTGSSQHQKYLRLQGGLGHNSTGNTAVGSSSNISRSSSSATQSIVASQPYTAEGAAALHSSIFQPPVCQLAPAALSAAVAAAATLEAASMQAMWSAQCMETACSSMSHAAAVPAAHAAAECSAAALSAPPAKKHCYGNNGILLRDKSMKRCSLSATIPAETILQLVLAFRPAAAALRALTPESAGPLTNQPIQDDMEPWVINTGSSTQPATTSSIQPKQLLCNSGLQRLSASMQCSTLCAQLQLLTDVAVSAVPSSPSCPGGGLAGWMWAAHALLQTVLSSPAVLTAGSRVGIVDSLKGLVASLVDLTDAVTLALQLLQQQPDGAAALSCTARPECGVQAVKAAAEDRLLVTLTPSAIVCSAQGYTSQDTADSVLGAAAPAAQPQATGPVTATAADESRQARLAHSKSAAAGAAGELQPDRPWLPPPQCNTHPNQGLQQPAVQQQRKRKRDDDQQQQQQQQLDVSAIGKAIPGGSHAGRMNAASCTAASANAHTTAGHKAAAPPAGSEVSGASSTVSGSLAVAFSSSSIGTGGHTGPSAQQVAGGSNGVLPVTGSHHVLPLSRQPGQLTPSQPVDQTPASQPQPGLQMPSAAGGRHTRDPTRPTAAAAAAAAAATASQQAAPLMPGVQLNPFSAAAAAATAAVGAARRHGPSEPQVAPWIEQRMLAAAQRYGLTDIPPWVQQRVLSAHQQHQSAHLNQHSPWDCFSVPLTGAMWSAGQWQGHSTAAISNTQPSASAAAAAAAAAGAEVLRAASPAAQVPQAEAAAAAAAGAAAAALLSAHQQHQSAQLNQPSPWDCFSVPLTGAMWSAGQWQGHSTAAISNTQPSASAAAAAAAAAGAEILPAAGPAAQVPQPGSEAVAAGAAAAEAEAAAAAAAVRHGPRLQAVPLSQAAAGARQTFLRKQRQRPHMTEIDVQELSVADRAAAQAQMAAACLAGNAAAAAAAAGDPAGFHQLAADPHAGGAIVASPEIVRSLVCRLYPAAALLLVLRPTSAQTLRGLTVEQDAAAPRHEYRAGMALQEELLQTESGIRAACRMQQPAALRQQLLAALDHMLSHGGVLADWFWRAYAAFLGEVSLAAVMQPDQLGPVDPAACLQGAVGSRVKFAELLVMAYNRLVRARKQQLTAQAAAAAAAAGGGGGAF